MEKQGEQQAVKVYLPRDEVACLVKLPERLSVTRSRATLQVAAKLLLPPGNYRLVVCDLQGQELLSQDAKAKQNTIDLSKLPPEAKPACVKLMQGTRLLDIAAVPAR